MTIPKQIANYLWVPIGIASFFIFSSQFFPLLNADDAVTILMIKDFQLPHDLYFWGQDRGGSLIPLLGWPLHHLLGLSVVLSESIVHTLILFLGYWCLSRFLESNRSRVIFALIWFFPAYWFFSAVRYQFGVQYSLTGIALYLIFRFKPGDGNGVKHHLPVILASITVAVALWVSDLEITSIVALLAIVFMQYKRSGGQWKPLLKMPELKILAVAVVLTACFVYYAKYQAVRVESYNHGILNSWSQAWDALSLLLSSIWHIMTFQKETIFLSIFSDLTILAIVLLFIIRPTIRKEQKPVYYFFLIDGLLLITVLLFSHWALANGLPRRYFVGMYLGCALIMLIACENCSGLRRKLTQTVLATVAVVGCLSVFHYMKTIYPKRLTPMVQVVGEFKQLGEIGVISEYWNSYITACPDPYQITAIPHDKDQNRNPALIKEVFSKPRLFIIKDMWLNEFPDSLSQYGYLLKRKGTSFEIGNCVVNEYTR